MERLECDRMFVAVLELGSFSDLIVNILDEGFDVAIRIGKLSGSSPIAHRLCDIRMAIAASADYILSKIVLIFRCENLFY